MFDAAFLPVKLREFQKVVHAETEAQDMNEASKITTQFCGQIEPFNHRVPLYILGWPEASLNKKGGRYA